MTVSRTTCFFAVLVLGHVQAFVPLASMGRLTTDRGMSPDEPAGSFFNPVPEDDKDKNKDKEAEEPKEDKPFDFDASVQELINQRKSRIPSSTLGGIPTSQAAGFGKSIKEVTKVSVKSTKSYVALGTPDKPINDPTKPEFDDQGYTLFTDEKTGEKSRVFQALVDYPSVFTMKIIGADDGAFVPEIVQIVAESCDVEFDEIKYSTRLKGKWTSVTVKAPVENADMLYQLYENIDRDPRVKFKF